ncbi:enterocin 1071A family bacteriocin [Anaerosacchariphilus polymeriproducens]|uniref:Bacteriocin n=1 Tax=Anaerosacchariphilus polymeriproducens TaxID=1812858 RepID=A0A371AXP5_9FIRM|nr:enterocin 1071A family bacteriocin [Anaerosacchariphilus polymeriproducens]RDU24334.1 hypothetical protein DWV06_04995 [Anaerosacchariphilus polymeriproducens]
MLNKFCELTINESRSINGGSAFNDIGNVVGKGLYYICKGLDASTTAGQMERWHKKHNK